MEGIRLYFCDKKIILEIIILSVTERGNTQGQGWEESSCRNTSQESGSILHDSLSGMKIFLRSEIKNFAQKRNQLFLVFPHPTPHWHWYPESCLVLPLGPSRIWALLFHYKNLTDILFFSFYPLSRYNFRAIYVFRISSLSSVCKSALVSIILFF